MKASTAQLLARWRDAKARVDEGGDPVFATMPEKSLIAKMLRADLEDARKAWIAKGATPTDRQERERSDFLSYRDRTGRVADFHAFRHTYITSLVLRRTQTLEFRASAGRSSL